MDSYSITYVKKAIFYVKIEILKVVVHLLRGSNKMYFLRDSTKKSKPDLEKEIVGLGAYVRTMNK